MGVLKSREGMETASRELNRLSPEITASIARMRRVAYNTGQVPSKYKLLTAAAISVAIRCEPCIRAYVEWAARKGATKQELIEFMNVAMTMQGCPGEEWALKALQAFDESGEGSTSGARGAVSDGDTPGREDVRDGGCCSEPGETRP